MRFLRCLVFGVVTVIFLSVLALPSLASEGKQESLPEQYKNIISAQITPTEALTIYLPIVIKSPNELSITALVYSGSDEYITISNNGPGSQLMDGWQIESVVGSQTYYFPNGITLAAGASLRVHSGPGAINNPPSNLFWTTAYIWNNDGDKAELRDSEGSVRDTYCYSSGCP